MLYNQEIEGCLDGAIGEFGVSGAELDGLLRESGPTLDRLRAHHEAGELSLLTLPYARDDLPGLSDLAAHLRQEFSHLILLGTGGSSLGGRAVVGLRGHPLAVAREGIELHFLDNADPHSVEGVLAAVDLSKTAFLVISKSGATPETLAQTLLCLQAVRAALSDDAVARHFYAITEPGESPLHRLAERFGFSVLDHDPRLGGRYSVFSAVGMLPAMVVGLDAGALRAGAAEVLDAAVGAKTPTDCPPALGAAAAVALLRHHGVDIGVLMPYADRFASFGVWYRQLWAESLGKDGTGITPIYGLGTVDQHSQLQLYLDGPRNKMFSLVCFDDPDVGSPIDPDLADHAGLDYLDGRSMTDLIAAEARATRESLADAGRPARLFRINAIDEPVMGALMMHFMVEVMVTARLLGVNPFTQPAVEQGKALARRYLKEMPRS
jgi:glucose-6-phosphate isomerase